MPAPKKNQYALGNSGGNPGFGQLEFIRKNANKFLPIWWDIIARHLNQLEDREMHKMAVQELNKIQMKCLPSNIDVQANPTPIIVNISKEIANKNGIESKSTKYDT